MQHDHHVAAEAAHLKSDFSPTLKQRAKQHTGQHNAHRVVAPHQCHRNTGKTRSGHKIKQQLAANAGNLVHADQPGQRSRQRHGYHHLVLCMDARVAGRASA